MPTLGLNPVAGWERGGSFLEYRRSDCVKEKDEGTLKEGDSVRVVDGMKFDVKFTDKS